ncbi:MAG TPA: hypothetical protein VF041_08160 [Gemmatimonadaceae bacterium]
MATWRRGDAYHDALAESVIALFETTVNTAGEPRGACGSAR